MRERERKTIGSRTKGSATRERERVGHRFLTFLENVPLQRYLASLSPPLFSHPRYRPTFFPNSSVGLSRETRGPCARCTLCLGRVRARIAYNRHRPAAVHSGRACERARARASTNGGNRFTWISIIVIKHATSMNYLFVGTAEYARRIESKKKEKKKHWKEGKRKEEFARAGGKEGDEKKKKKHVAESIMKAVKVPSSFSSWMLGPVRERRKGKREIDRGGRDAKETEERAGKRLSLPRFVEARASRSDICILRRGFR